MLNNSLIISKRETAIAVFFFNHFLNIYFLIVLTTKKEK